MHCIINNKSLYNNSLANYQSLCPKCAPHTRTQFLRRNATISDS